MQRRGGSGAQGPAEGLQAQQRGSRHNRQAPDVAGGSRHIKGAPGSAGGSRSSRQASGAVGRLQPQQGGSGARVLHSFYCWIVTQCFTLRVLVVIQNTGIDVKLYFLIIQQLRV